MVHFQENVSLKNHSSYRIGGPARYFFEARNLEEVKAAISRFRQIEEKQDIKLPLFILGGGTNVLFSDQGFPGLILKINLNFIRWQDNGRVQAGAGVLMSELVQLSVQKKLAGLEWAAGLPGTIGGAVRGNAGAFGSEIKNLIVEVLSINFCEPGLIIRRSNKDCLFSYRSSIFKETGNQEIIIEAGLKLFPGGRETIEKKIREYIDYRQFKQPLEYPSAGSVFKNVPWEKLPAEHQEFFLNKKKEEPFPVVPAACLLAEAGLRGKRRGGAEISEKHSNFIINKNNAASDDVVFLIELAKKTVRDKFGVEMEEEIKIIG